MAIGKILVEFLEFFGGIGLTSQLSAAVKLKNAPASLTPLLLGLHAGSV